MKGGPGGWHGLGVVLLEVWVGGWEGAGESREEADVEDTDRAGTGRSGAGGGAHRSQGQTFSLLPEPGHQGLKSGAFQSCGAKEIEDRRASQRCFSGAWNLP